MKCPHCQADNREGAEFCGECGKPLRSEIICSSCGNSNPKGKKFCDKCGQSLTEPATDPTKKSTANTAEPTSFVNDRYQVKKKLGEGGKKKVYLVHDKKLDRNAAFALIKTENLDEDGRKRIVREAQAMGKLGDNPHIVSIFDMGEINDQPYIVIPVMGGGDVEGLIEKAPEHKLPLDQTISIAKAVCQGLIFAHAKGVIHRDLKPGNVWLTDDGITKIGDFGLAVMTDVSRLTMEGMMVGTVSYMPPEQAMGGEVTPKADLYSLGAMLYEMVTGRPPFIGDDSVSIIGQHLNAQPISPTWHRADLPPAFESLIMLLLEKDPEKRPTSAKGVLQALESIEKGDFRESVTEHQIITENPVYRSIFIGRENELKQLQNAFTGALSGHGALMMVVGEPGIGKTAICEQLATFVTLRGGKTLWGHCYEEGSLSLPYLAFVEAIRSYVMDREAADLKKELGSGATDVARIVSEIREKLRVEPRESQNPEEDRYRLMQAVTSFLTNAASVKPILVILEDLHDADKGTLEMLSYVSRNLSGTRLLLVGTYRDVEVDRNHPLSGALAELRRVSSFGRVLLRGLNIDEVRRMLSGITREEIPVRLAEAVHRQTEGNPLFVQEVVRYLTEEKLIDSSGEKMKTSDIAQLESNIPEGLRDVIGKRLTNLSEECNRLLSVAAVIGRDFSIDTLRLVVNLDEEVFLNALKEAIQTAVLEERKRPGTIYYRFTHAFFRQTLYEEMIAPRRLQLHQQVARALEKQYEKRLGEHASELAEHFSQSTDPSDLEKAVKYGEMAAAKAIDVYAYSEAVRLLDQAINIQEILDPENKEKRCDLMLVLCDALLGVPDTRRVIESEANETYKLCESIGDDTKAARASKLALWAIGLEQAGPGYVTPEFAEWTKRADLHAQPNTPERAYADCSLGTLECLTGNTVQGYQHLFQALNLSRQLDDNEAYYAAGFLLLLGRSGPRFTKERLRLAEELLERSRKGLRGRNARILAWIGDTLLAAGNRQRAEKVFNELRTLVEQRPGDILLRDISTMMDAVISLYDGKIIEAWDSAEEVRINGEATGTAIGTNVWASIVRLRAGVYLGYSLELEDTDVLGAALLNSVILTNRGQKEEALSFLEANIWMEQDENSFIHTVSYVPILILEIAVLSGNHRTADFASNLLKDSELYTSGMWYPTCIQRHLGGASSLLRRYDEAREYYKEAFKVCIEMNFRPELALTHLDFAELLLDHFPKEKAEAIEHLDFAIKEFREMKMQPSLERALRRKDILKA